MKKPIIEMAVALLIIFAISYSMGDLTEDAYLLGILITLYGLILVEYKDIKKIKILIIASLIIAYHGFIWSIFDWHNQQIAKQEENVTKTALMVTPSATLPLDITEGQELINSKISWDGIVVAKMTYGRIRVKKLPEDDRYPYFVVEDYDGAELGGYTGNIRVQGRVDMIDCKPTPVWQGWQEKLGLKDDQCIPWVVVERIKEY